MESEAGPKEMSFVLNDLVIEVGNMKVFQSAFQAKYEHCCIYHVPLAPPTTTVCRRLLAEGSEAEF